MAKTGKSVKHYYDELTDLKTEKVKKLIEKERSKKQQDVLIHFSSPFTPKPQIMTEAEQKALDMTVELWNQMLELEVLHPSDRSETCRDIHNIQNRIMSRTERRKEIVSSSNEDDEVCTTIYIKKNKPSNTQI